MRSLAVVNICLFFELSSEFHLVKAKFEQQQIYQYEIFQPRQNIFQAYSATPFSFNQSAIKSASCALFFSPIKK
ncbi:hypothetical protein EDC44_10683 [Cricetibacter osteomyelitidis]|uniref:Uncharacterized protein n=1 Tax=Cricetibacter osteomyelitidis TaxID=1521931 RepID=A0A4R2T5B5_9PAST|nr:hypothetical protein EDC44_10683 [Cricetibacter osteomyelitidis]